MASPSRDRVTIDLCGIGNAVRATAAGQGLTVSQLARQTLVASLDACPTVTIAPGSDRQTPGPSTVKLTLRLSSIDAEVLMLKSAALGLSYGGLVARLVRGTPLPARSADRAADRDALIASSDHLADLSVDLNALVRMLRAGDPVAAERCSTAATSLADDIRRHLDLASRVIARTGAEP